MAISATSWLTTCLHYNEHWEALLTKAVKPYADVVLQTGVAESFFFERSTHRGPHLRLWFKSTEFLLENMLKPNLLEHFQQYFEAKPSDLAVPKYPSNFPEHLRWRPNNSVHFEEIRPGIAEGINEPSQSILEQQYQASSEMVLNILQKNGGNWSGTEKLSTAIKLHLGMFYACGLSLKEAANFAAWAYEYRLEEMKADLLNEQVEDLKKYFQSNFSLQRKDLLSYVSALWELLKNYRSIGDATYIDWIHANSSANLEISLALDAGKLDSLKTGLRSIPSAWVYYADFIQKTNNRLGLSGKQEGYLYFSLAQCLRQLCQNSLSFSAKDFPKINAA